MPRVKTPSVPPPAPKPLSAPYPHKNLGTHLKAPKAGEYVTLHHRGAKTPGGCK